MARRLTTDWSAVLASAPLDKKAAVVAGGKGAHWEPKLKPHDHEYARSVDGPLPTKPVAPGEEDLTGRKVGRFTVIGKAAGAQGWVVRCACGAYERRRSKTLTQSDPLGAATMCVVCDKLEYVAGRRRVRQ